MRRSHQNSAHDAAAAHLSRLLRADAGNVTVLMAIAMMAVILAAGIAVDTARLLNAKTALAAAADAAALQVGNAKPRTQEQIEALATEVVLKNYQEREHGPLK